MGIIKVIYVLIRAFLTPRLMLAAENLALRQQVSVYKHSVKRRKLRPRDRAFWVWLSKFWCGWRSSLAIVQPETAIRWHRQGFQLYWRWKSRAGKRGRPRIPIEIRDLIRRMSRENLTWGALRILSERVFKLTERHKKATTPLPGVSSQGRRSRSHGQDELSQRPH